MKSTKKKLVAGTGFITGKSPGRENEDEDSPAIAIGKMTDMELDKEFERMLDNMNLTEQKKEPLRRLPKITKREMVINYYKTNASARHRLDSPSDYIRYLSGQDMSSIKKSKCIESLRVALTSNGLDWVQEFGDKGLLLLLGVIKDCLTSNPSCEKLHLECLKCLKAIMNNKVGLKNLFDQSEALTLLARSIIPDKPQVALEAVKLMAAVCLVPPDGHDATLEAITEAAEIKDLERFQLIVQGLLICNNEPLRVACMTLINAIISSPEDLDFRLHLRNEFMRIGLLDVLEVLVENPCEELETQLKVFLDHKEEDYEEFASRFDNIRLDLEDIDEVFQIVKHTVTETAAEPYLLSILQHLLCIRDDYFVRPAYYKLIEECVSQIVLHKSGCDPDFSRRFELDVDPLIDNLVERGKIEDAANVTTNSLVLGPSLEAAITEKQELEAKLSQAWSKIEQLEQQINVLQHPVSQIGGDCPSLTPSPSLSGTTSSFSSVPVPPPPPPPPSLNFGGQKFPGTPTVSGASIPVPPPPPPFPSQLSQTSVLSIPVPPPPPSTAFPPVPMSSPMSQVVDIFIKLGMKRKKKWTVNGQIKRTNWKVIPVNNLTEKAFWASVDEEKYASANLISELQSRFGSKPSLSKQESSTSEHGSAKKCKELRFLDSKGRVHSK